MKHVLKTLGTHLCGHQSTHEDMTGVSLVLYLAIRIIGRLFLQLHILISLAVLLHAIIPNNILRFIVMEFSDQAVTRKREKKTTRVLARFGRKSLSSYQACPQTWEPVPQHMLWDEEFRKVVVTIDIAIADHVHMKV